MGEVIDLHRDEKELIRQAVATNRFAQERLFNKFSPKMLSVCRQYIKDLHKAEDVMISAFMKVFLHLESYSHSGSFEGWIRRIMVNECISFLRVQKKLHYTEEEYFFEESTDEINQQFSLEQIQALIDNLPEGYRTIFILYAIEGYKHREIAKMLRISEGTSKSQFSHARKILQQQITILNKKLNETK